MMVAFEVLFDVTATGLASTLDEATVVETVEVVTAEAGVVARPVAPDEEAFCEFTILVPRLEYCAGVGVVVNGAVDEVLVYSADINTLSALVVEGAIEL